MKYAKMKVHTILLLGTGFILPLQMTVADFGNDGNAFIVNNNVHNMVQNKANWQQLELSEGQTRSKVEHALVNYLLGHTIDQYLELGSNDESSKKSPKNLKLRLNEHHIVLVYQFNF